MLPNLVLMGMFDVHFHEVRISILSGKSKMKTLLSTIFASTMQYMHQIKAEGRKIHVGI